MPYTLEASCAGRTARPLPSWGRIEIKLTERKRATVKKAPRPRVLSAYNLSIKVPEATAAAIRAEYASGQKPSIRELAGRYGISHETVRKLVSRNAPGAQNRRGTRSAE